MPVLNVVGARDAGISDDVIEKKLRDINKSLGAPIDFDLALMDESSFEVLSDSLGKIRDERDAEVKETQVPLSESTIRVPEEPAPAAPLQSGPPLALELGSDEEGPLNEPQLEPSPKAESYPVYNFGTQYDKHYSKVGNAIPNLEPYEIAAMSDIESNHLNRLVASKDPETGASTTGVQGVMQVTESTGNSYLQNFDPTNEDDSILAGSLFLSDLKTKYGDMQMAASAYNGGPGLMNQAVKKAKQTGEDWTIAIHDTEKGQSENVKFAKWAVENAKKHNSRVLAYTMQPGKRKTDEVVRHGKKYIKALDTYRPATSAPVSKPLTLEETLPDTVQADATAAPESPEEFARNTDPTVIGTPVKATGVGALDAVKRQLFSADAALRQDRKRWIEVGQEGRDAWAMNQAAFGMQELGGSAPPTSEHAISDPKFGKKKTFDEFTPEEIKEIVSPGLLKRAAKRLDKFVDPETREEIAKAHKLSGNPMSWLSAGVTGAASNITDFGLQWGLSATGTPAAGLTYQISSQTGMFLEAADRIADAANMTPKQKYKWQEVTDQLAFVNGTAGGIMEYAGNAIGPLASKGTSALRKKLIGKVIEKVGKEGAKKTFVQAALGQLLGINAEGLTELGQSGLMNVLMTAAMKKMAKEDPELGKTLDKFYEKEDLLDSYLQGMLTAAVLGGGKSALSRAAKTDSELDEEKLMELTNEIALNEKLTDSERVRKIYSTQLDKVLNLNKDRTEKAIKNFDNRFIIKGEQLPNGFQFTGETSRRDGKETLEIEPKESFLETRAPELLLARLEEEHATKQQALEEAGLYEEGRHTSQLTLLESTDLNEVLELQEKIKKLKQSGKIPIKGEADVNLEEDAALDAPPADQASPPDQAPPSSTPDVTELESALKIQEDIVAKLNDLESEKGLTEEQKKERDTAEDNAETIFEDLGVKIDEQTSISGSSTLFEDEDSDFNKQSKIKPVDMFAKKRESNSDKERYLYLLAKQKFRELDAEEIKEVDNAKNKYGDPTVDEINKVIAEEHDWITNTDPTVQEEKEKEEQQKLNEKIIQFPGNKNVIEGASTGFDEESSDIAPGKKALQTVQTMPEDQKADAIESIQIAARRQGLSEEEADAVAIQTMDNLDEDSAPILISALSIQKRAKEVDDLTDLNNYAWLKRNKLLIKGKDNIGNEIDIPADGRQMFIDIDDFGKFNKKHGQKNGDRAISVVGALMKEHYGKIGTPLRIGGEELSVRFNENVTPEQIKTADQSFRNALANQDFQGEKITVSSGIADTYDESDAQMVAAKKAGKNRTFEGGKVYAVETVTDKKGKTKGKKRSSSKSPTRKKGKEDKTIKPGKKGDTQLEIRIAEFVRDISTDKSVLRNLKKKKAPIEEIKSQEITIDENLTALKKMRNELAKRKADRKQAYKEAKIKKGKEYRDKVKKRKTEKSGKEPTFEKKKDISKLPPEERKKVPFEERTVEKVSKKLYDAAPWMTKDGIRRKVSKTTGNILELNARDTFIEALKAGDKKVLSEVDQMTSKELGEIPPHLRPVKTVSQEEFDKGRTVIIDETESYQIDRKTNKRLEVKRGKIEKKDLTPEEQELTDAKEVLLKAAKKEDKEKRKSRKERLLNRKLIDKTGLKGKTLKMVNAYNRLVTVEQAILDGSATAGQLIEATAFYTKQLEGIKHDLAVPEARMKAKGQLPRLIEMLERESLKGKSVTRILQTLDVQQAELRDEIDKVLTEMKNLQGKDARDPNILLAMRDRLEELEQKIIRDEPLEASSKKDIPRQQELEDEVAVKSLWKPEDLPSIGMIIKIEKALARGEIEPDKVEQAKLLIEEIKMSRGIKGLNEKDMVKKRNEYRKAIQNPDVDKKLTKDNDALKSLQRDGLKAETQSEKKRIQKAIELRQQRMDKIRLGFNPELNISVKDINRMIRLAGEIKQLEQSRKKEEEIAQRAIMEARIIVKSGRLGEMYNKIDDRFRDIKPMGKKSAAALNELYKNEKFKNQGGFVSTEFFDALGHVLQLRHTRKGKAEALVGSDINKVTGATAELAMAAQLSIKNITNLATDKELDVMTFVQEGEFADEVKDFAGKYGFANEETRQAEALKLAKKVIPSGKNFNGESIQTEFADILLSKERTSRMKHVSKLIKEHNDLLKRIYRGNQKESEIPKHMYDWYVSHIWGKQGGKGRITQDDIQERRKFMTVNPSEEKSRTYSTYSAGIKAGLTPRFTNVAKIMDLNTQVAIQVITNQQLIKLLKGNNKSGVTLLQEGTVYKKEKTVDGKKIKEVDVEKTAARRAAMKNMGWKNLDRMGSEIKELEGMYVDPSMVPLINAMFTDKWRNSAMQAVELVNGIMKKGNLSLALFHHLALAETGIGTQGFRKTAKAAANYDAILEAGKNGSFKLILREWETASDFVRNGGQLGDITDVQRDQLDNVFTDVAEAMEKISPKLAAPFKAMRNANRVWDRVLWDFFHNTLKIEGYKHAVQQNLQELDSGASETEIEIVKRETAKAINDTFGGQNWKALMANPRMMQTMQTLLLSPDWTKSTASQFLKPFGLGAITRTAFGAKVQAKTGGRFWANSLVKYWGALQLVNAAFRIMDDEKEWKKNLRAHEKRLAELELDLAENALVRKFADPRANKKWLENKADDIKLLNEKLDKVRKNKPQIKPENIMDYTMYGNDVGHKTEVLFGRGAENDEGKRPLIYRGAGKQHMDIVDFFLLTKGPAGIEFNPRDATIHKMLAKGSPLLQTGALIASSFIYDPKATDGLASLPPRSLSGFRNRKVEKAKQRGSEEFYKTLTLELAKAPLPFSWRTMADPSKDFTPADLALPQRKGASFYTVREGVRKMIDALKTDKSGERHKKVAKVFFEIRKSSKRNYVDFATILGTTWDGAFTHMESELNKTHEKIGLLQSKEKLSKEDEGEIAKLQFDALRIEDYMENLSNASDLLDDQMNRAEEERLDELD